MATVSSPAVLELTNRAGKLSCIALLLLAAGAAQAEPNPAPNRLVEDTQRASDGGYHLLVEATTDFPVLVGGRLELEFPRHWRLGAAIGATPSAYLDATESIVTEIAGVDADISALVRSVLQQGFAVRTFAAWSPRQSRGFYLQFGYTMMQVSGSVASTDVLTSVIDDPTFDIEGSATLRSTLHGLHGEIGYRFLIEDFTLRLALGLLGTVASSSDIRIDSPVFPAQADQLAQESEAELDAVIRQYAFTPTLSLGLGYDFALGRKSGSSPKR